MKYLSLLLLIGFVGLAVLGVFSMNHGDMQKHDGSCLAAGAKGLDCPEETRLIDYIAFHLGAYEGLFLATFGESVLGVLLLTFLALLFRSLAFLFSPLFKLLQLALYRRHLKVSFCPPQKQELTHWLALHENSPAVS